MTDKELARQAIALLESSWEYVHSTSLNNQIREFLAAVKSRCTRCGKVSPAEIHTCSPQKQEPVAYLVYDKGASNQYLAFDDELGDMDGCDIQPLYTAAPQREWQGLTKEDTFEIAERLGLADVAWVDLMRAIDAKLKKKNG
jgi:hypothetical protein